MASPDGSRHAGRPRDPAIDQAILEATLNVLHEHGYAGFSLEAVATRAGTTKPTIARRWRRRQELIIAALATVLVRPPVPDTGCTRCDLIDGIELLADAVLRRMPPAVLAPLIADCAPDRELHQYLTDALVLPTREALALTVKRAIDRGHLRSDTNPELVVDLFASMVFQGGLFADSRFDAQRVVEAVDLVLRGIAVSFTTLIELSEINQGEQHRHPE
ncbi:TetR/AcrR family transcriptional regulator [Phytoactinopolyspora mesophila]|uniref:TetR family transcriptional regulator n=1 Tax=Phytoactinopolyspora mesophila TaxID=2650750 RepID=A0A7K3M2E9_9ACTN|nr:TetR/AcrR family transcriptional regulator [Phytoactinopolyspora mesophila]NDL57207.1 TetR family transcriptional regulator [Phytoactinopolyspora mesophila]